MRDINERMAAVKKRTTELEREIRWRRSSVIALGSVAVCLLLILGLALKIPAWTTQFISAPQTGESVVASLFTGSDMLGVLVVGILAFLLGAAVTVLCFRLRKWTQDKD